MKKMVLTAVTLSMVVFGSAQGILGKVKNAVNSAKSGGSPLSTDEIVSGLKEALSVGTNNSTGKLSAADGFFKDLAVKILMPPEAEKVEKTLRSLGAGQLVDDAILSLNRAAEDASKTAAPIFLDAIKSMTVNDALGILKGSDTAATSYLKKSTTVKLTASFKPIIETSLQKTGATKYWAAVFERYNKVPLVKKVNTDLPGYATDRALYGIFYYVAQEEAKIRNNPAARVTDILKKVFAK